MKRAKRIGILTCLLSILLLVNNAIAVEKEISDKKDAEYHIKLSKEYFKKEQWNEAIKEYTKAIALKPDDASLYYARGYTYKKQGFFYDNAIEDLSIAIALQPNNSALYYVRGIVYLFHSFSLEKEWENAVKDFDKAISLTPNVALFYFKRGYAYHLHGQYEKAISDYTKAIELKPDTREKIYSLFQKIDGKIGLFEEIFKDYSPEKQLVDLYENRGHAYRLSVHNKEAINDYKKLIIIQSDSDYTNSSANSYLVDLYEKENRLNEGIEFFSEVISLRPKEADLYYSRANIYTGLKQYDKALKDYTKAIELTPNVKQNKFYLGRGDVYREMKQYDKAIEDFAKAIELEPEDSDPYLSRGRVYFGIKQYDKAIEDFSKVISLIEIKPYPVLRDLFKDDEAIAYFFRGSAYTEFKKYAKAKADYQKACDFKKDFCVILTKFERELAEIEKWQPLGKSEKGSFYYDKTSIRKQPNGHIRVWMKRTVEDIPTYVEDRKKTYQKTEGYENYSHSLDLWEFDCDSANLGGISLIDYDDKGNVLYSYHEDEKLIKMKPAVPGSLGDALYKIICKEER